MNSRSVFLTCCLLAAFAVASVARGEAQITTDVAPPAARAEIAPPARDGYAWSSGHWEWSGRAYYWVTGTWVVQRRRARYVASRWEQTGTQWHFVSGHWER